MKLPNFRFFKHNFVSLVISQNDLRLVKVDTKRNKIIKFAQAKVPPGVISNHRLRDKDALSAIIRDMWKKSRVGEKYVGVVVPEFSTYTKSIELPNLADTEIAEALQWQIQEYLPVSIEDVIFDWKVIKRERDRAHVQVVAILKDVLFGYIDAVGMAGLLPLVVETPSQSIQRMTKDEAVGKLIIYLNQNEAILTISSALDMVASAVVSAQDFKVIVRTAQQMLSHYSNVKVEKVLVGGVGVTQDLVKFLNYNLGQTVKFLNVEIKGMLPAQVQDFLVGISLQYKDPLPPASELTINLLPPSWEQYYSHQDSGVKGWALTLIASVAVWSCFLSLVVTMMIFELRIEELKKSDAQVRTQELNQVTSEVRGINSKADAAIEISNSLIAPQEILNSIAVAIPEGVSVDYYRVNFETGETILRGTATTRPALMAFKTSLEENENNENVNLPISSLVRDINLEFEITFYYKPLIPAKTQSTPKININR